MTRPTKPRDDELTADDRHSATDRQHLDLPKPSPIPKDELGADPSPSGSHNVATIREVLTINDTQLEPISAKAEKTAKSTRLQWVGLGVLSTAVLTASGFLVWCLATVLTLGTAQAQTKATADAALEGGKANATRIDVVDAGARQAVERLEKKIDENDAKHDRQIDALNSKLDKIADAVRARH